MERGQHDTGKSGRTQLACMVQDSSSAFSFSKKNVHMLLMIRVLVRDTGWSCLNSTVLNVSSKLLLQERID